jgi:murein DD-endopeptidase MepM/ murein hydrolase activator NlpD
LNAFGIREKGLRSRTLEKYAIFNETIYSPCDGQVVEGIDFLPDIEPLSQPSTYGNYIMIKMKNNVFIRMEHLKQGSIMVKTGETVKSGQAIARVGNSGMTDVPHLHIQAMTGMDFNSAKGLPIIFDGKYPARNSLFFK